MGDKVACETVEQISCEVFLLWYSLNCKCDNFSAKLCHEVTSGTKSTEAIMCT